MKDKKSASITIFLHKGSHFLISCTNSKTAAQLDSISLTDNKKMIRYCVQDINSEADKYLSIDIPSDKISFKIKLCVPNRPVF